MRIVRDVQLLLKHEDTLKAVAPILFAKKGDTFDVALPYDWEQYLSWEDSRVLARTFHFVEIKDGCIHLELHPVEYMMPMQSELFFKFDVEEIFGDSLPSDGCGHPDGDKDDPQDKPCYNLKTFRVLISGAGLFRKTSDEKLQYLRECDEESTSDEEGSLQTTDDYDSADDSASDEPAAQ